MKNSKEFEGKRKQFLAYLVQMDANITDYISALKNKSSEEVLNGSASVAKKYLDEIILLESKTNDFSRLIENIVNLIRKNDDNESEEKDNEITGKTEKQNEAESELNNTKGKIPILKSLIYLGGIAKEEEIKKYLNEYNGRNGKEDMEFNELKNNLDSMLEKEMISIDTLDQKIEILQSGIDFLAKYEA